MPESRSRKSSTSVKSSKTSDSAEHRWWKSMVNALLKKGYPKDKAYAIAYATKKRVKAKGKTPWKKT